MVSHLPAWPFRPGSLALGCVVVIGVGVALVRLVPRVDEPRLSGASPLAPSVGANLQLEQGVVRVLVLPLSQVVIHWLFEFQERNPLRLRRRVDSLGQ